jgi:hypothetical protein
MLFYEMFLYTSDVYIFSMYDITERNQSLNTNDNTRPQVQHRHELQTSDDDGRPARPERPGALRTLLYQECGSHQCPAGGHAVTGGRCVAGGTRGLPGHLHISSFIYLMLTLSSAP